MTSGGRDFCTRAVLILSCAVIEVTEGKPVYITYGRPTHAGNRNATTTDAPLYTYGSTYTGYGGNSEATESVDTISEQDYFRLL